MGLRVPALGLVLLTDRRAAGDRGLVATVSAAVAGGARWVVLREKDLGSGEREELGRELMAILAPAGGRLSVAGHDAGLAGRLGAAGLHLAAAEVAPVQRRGLILGRSCHDLAEVRAAVAEGLDYVSVSPVFPTASKPGYGPALSLDGLADLVGATSLPVLALGGIGADSAAACLGAGAAGVAVMGSVMAAPDPEAATRSLVAALAPDVTPESPSPHLLAP